MFRLFMRHLPAALLATLIVGTVTGGIEGFLIFLQQKAFNPPRALVIVISLMSAAYWVLLAPAVALGLTLYLRIIRKVKPGKKKNPLLGRYLLLCLFLYGMLSSWMYAYTNLQDKPFAPMSLLMDAGIVALFSIVTFLLIRPVRWLENRGRGFKMSVLSVWAVLLAGIAAAGYLYPDSNAAGNVVAGKPTATRPNVLFVLVDTLRSDHLGCYGYKEKSGRDTSASVDALAADGVLFENCLSQSSWTRPSVTSILTSTVPPRHRVNHLMAALPSGFNVLPDDMSQLNYKTAMISASPQISNTFGFGLGADCYRGNFVNVTRDCSSGKLAALMGRFFKFVFFKIDVPSDFFVEQAGSYLRKVQKNIGMDADNVNHAFLEWLDEVGDKRFFAYLHYMEPHTPYDPDPPYDTLYQNDYDGDPMTHPPLDANQVMIPLEEGKALDGDEFHEITALYDGEITQFSHKFGKLIAELKKRGLYDDLLVVFVSDHGEEFYDHKGWEHGHSVYNELIRVPLIIKFPGNAHAGKSIEAYCQTIDIVPFFFDFMGAEQWDQTEGGSLLPLVNGEPLPADVKWRTISCTEYHADIPVRSYIEGNYKLIHVAREKDVWLLYDMTANPEETRSLTAEKPEIFNRMRRKLKEIYKRYDKFATEGASADMGSDMKDQLKALGYGH